MMDHKQRNTLAYITFTVNWGAMPAQHDTTATYWQGKNLDICGHNNIFDQS